MTLQACDAVKFRVVLLLERELALRERKSAAASAVGRASSLPAQAPVCGMEADVQDVDDEAFGWHTVVSALAARGITDAETAFSFIDADAGGTISYPELQVAVAELGLTAGAATCCGKMQKKKKQY